ncbi:acetyltransferase [Thozetella sp. PMI_491]|nr:acetyltransferase [Thozetella sp. PMI_491]
MATYSIIPCTIADSDEIASNNLVANWTSQHRRLTWPHRTPEYHLSQTVKRMPRLLLDERETSRHEKAVDSQTGRVLGYARWDIPKSHATQPDGTPAWPEAVMPAVGPEEEAEIHRIAESAHWDPKTEGSHKMDEKTTPIKKSIVARKPYMSLDLLAVHPESQNMGIGTALTRSGMKQAEKLGLDIFIVATKQGAGVYKRLGFRMESEIIQDDSMYGGTGEHYTGFMVFEQISGLKES